MANHQVSICIHLCPLLSTPLIAFIKPANLLESHRESKSGINVSLKRTEKDETGPKQDKTNTKKGWYYSHC